MARIPSSVWLDPEFQRLSTKRQIVLLGLISFARWDLTLPKDSRHLWRLIGKPCGISLRSFERCISLFEKRNLVGSPEFPGRFVSLDPDRSASRPARKPLARSLREAVIERDGMVCQLCGGDIPEGDLHVDHIFPVSKGGTDELSNLQAAHSRCNISKGARV